MSPNQENNMSIETDSQFWWCWIYEKSIYDYNKYAKTSIGKMNIMGEEVEILRKMKL